MPTVETGTPRRATVGDHLASFEVLGVNETEHGVPCWSRMARHTPECQPFEQYATASRWSNKERVAAESGLTILHVSRRRKDSTIRRQPACISTPLMLNVLELSFNLLQFRGRSKITHICDVNHPLLK